MRARSLCAPLSITRVIVRAQRSKGDHRQAC
jgi:hypothetical protein